MAPNPDNKKVAADLGDDLFFRRRSFTGEIFPTPPAKPETEQKRTELQSLRCSTFGRLVIYGLAELFGGFTFSLLSPFYTKEAINKGLSVTETGLVYGSVFITMIIFSPIFGKQIGRIGSRNLFLYGTFVAGMSNVLFGLLEWVFNSTAFLALSFAIRIVSAIGESAFFCSVYPMASQDAPDEYKSTVLSVMETMFGLGMMAGPFIGGLLYEIDGFYFPFVVCGGCLVACTILGSFFLDNPVVSTADSPNKISYFKLFLMPCVSVSCFVLVLAEASVTWYLPSLQPFLEDNFQLDMVTTGAMFMLEGATYAAMSPVWGYLLDKFVGPALALALGCLAIIVGYCLLGPAPFLPGLPQSIYLVATGLFVQGCGVAAIFITTLMLMLNGSVAAGAPDTEQTRGMITSLWFIGENLGGYVGSTAGGVAYDSMGFENSTMVIVGLQFASLASIAVLWWADRRKPAADPNDGNANNVTASLLGTATNTTNYSSTAVENV